MSHADQHETEALRALDAGNVEAAQVFAALAVSQRLADLRRDRFDAALLRYGRTLSMTESAKRERGESP